MTSAQAAAKRSSSAVTSGGNGDRKRLVLVTWTAPGTNGSNGVLIAASPVIDSAPMVVPWYASVRAMTFVRPGCPMVRKYARANFHADSTASEPPVVKNTRFRSPGASPASRAASSTAAGWAADQIG